MSSTPPKATPAPGMGITRLLTVAGVSYLLGVLSCAAVVALASAFPRAGGGRSPTISVLSDSAEKDGLRFTVVYLKRHEPDVDGVWPGGCTLAIVALVENVSASSIIPLDPRILLLPTGLRMTDEFGNEYHAHGPGAFAKRMIDLECDLRPGEAALRAFLAREPLDKATALTLEIDSIRRSGGAAFQFKLPSKKETVAVPKNYPYWKGRDQMTVFYRNPRAEELLDRAAKHSPAWAKP